MIERKERKPYWRHTKWQMIWTVVPLVVALVVIPLYGEVLNSNKFLGFPLGFFMVGHGLLIVALFTVASFVDRQESIDRWHGANEDS